MDFKGAVYCILLIVAVYLGFNYLYLSTDVFASFDLVDEVGFKAGVNNLSMLNMIIEDFTFFITSSCSQISLFFVEQFESVNAQISNKSGSPTFSKSFLILSLIPFFPFLMALVKPYEV